MKYSIIETCRNSRTFGNKSTSRDHQNYSIINFGQNTEKCPGDLWRRCYSDSSERPSANTGEKNSHKDTIITAQNSTIRTNYVKVKINKTQQNNKYSSCCDGDKTINYILSERSKLLWDKIWLGGEGDPQRIVQGIEIWRFY